MLSKSAAKAFFIAGTVICAGTFGLLTVDTIARVPAQTNQQNLTEDAIRGKDLWDASNCMGCHTILGEGAYYAPELTKVYERRGPAFIEAMLKDPAAMYPGRRRMQQYDFSEGERKDLIAFLKWIGEMDLNGFPAKPSLVRTTVTAGNDVVNDVVAQASDRPAVFNQMCIACHSLAGQGGTVGPALDGVGARLSRDFIEGWLKDPIAVKAESKMPKLPLTDNDIVELAAFLSQLK